MTLDEWKSLLWRSEVKLFYNENDDERIEALREIGDMYYKGSFIEIKKDLEKAYDYYQRAAKLGDVHSIRVLGDGYAEGYNHLEKNLDNALKWFQMGSDIGDDYCKKRLERLNKGDINDDY